MIMIVDNELHQEIVITIEIEVTQETAMIITDSRHIDNEHHQDNVIALEVSPDICTNVIDPETIINRRTDRRIISFQPIHNNRLNNSIRQLTPFNRCQ